LPIATPSSARRSTTPPSPSKPASERGGPAPGRRFAEGAGRRGEALANNRRLWSLLAADCAAEGNQLPQSLRAQIISLSIFVDRHSSAVMRQGAAFDVLIEINRTVMQGLSPTPQMATAG